MFQIVPKSYRPARAKSQSPAPPAAAARSPLSRIRSDHPPTIPICPARSRPLAPSLCPPVRLSHPRSHVPRPVADPSHSTVRASVTRAAMAAFVSCSGAALTPRRPAVAACAARSSAFAGAAVAAVPARVVVTAPVVAPVLPVMPEIEAMVRVAFLSLPLAGVTVSHLRDCWVLEWCRDG